MADGAPQDAGPEVSTQFPEVGKEAVQNDSRNQQRQEITVEPEVLSSLIQLHTRLEELRDRAVTSRVHLRDDRSKLKEARGIASDKEAELISSLRNLRQFTDDPSLNRLFEDTLSARDKYSELQHDYDEDEDQYEIVETTHNTQEWDLRIQERTFIFQIRDLVPFVDADDYYPQNFGSITKPQNGDAWPKSQREDDASRASRNKYLELRAIENNLEDQMAELESERAEILHYQAAKKHWREEISTGTDDEDSLENLSEDYQINKAELDNVRAELDQLRDSVLDVQPRNRKGRRASESDLRQYLQPAESPDPPVDLDARSESKVSTLWHEIEQTRRRVNEWIWEILSVSRFERARLKAMVNQPGLKDKDWWTLVKSFWNKDMDFDKNTASFEKLINTFAASEIETSCPPRKRFEPASAVAGQPGDNRVLEDFAADLDWVEVCKLERKRSRAKTAREPLQSLSRSLSVGNRNQIRRSKSHSLANGTTHGAAM